MPDNQSSPQSEPEGFANRAARRRRGKDTLSTRASEKVRDNGRRTPVPGPRNWSTRRSG
ncbi:MAG TPA: hypothetical protein VGP31_08525 [Planosporangium sp.]|jgi:hypothetical protein|nr:hypothetical protein [Planosporangium sp.]